MSNAVEIILKVVGGAAAKAQIDSVNRSVETMRKVWGAISGAAATAGVTVAIRSMLRAAEESRVATFQLEQAVRLIEGASSGAASALARQASELEGLTGVADESVMAVQRVLLSLGATADQVERLTPLVLDVAAAMGTDAVAAARKLGAAFRGQEVRLEGLNIRSRDFNDLMAQLNTRFRGQAEALMQARGPTAQLAIEIGDLAEKTGELVEQLSSPAIAKFTEIIKGWRGAVSGILDLRGAGEAMQSMVNAAAVVPPRVNPGGFGGFDEESAAIEAERQRQLDHAQQILQVEADINNLYGFRRTLIQNDPTIGEVDRRRMLLEVARDEVGTLREREALLVDDYQRALRGDPGRTLDTTVEAGRAANEATGNRILTEREIEFLERYDSYGGALVQRTNDLRDAFGSMARNMANVTFDTITAGVEGLGNALTGIIMGTKTAAQAFAQFGVSMLTNFIQMITTSILYAKVAIPVLTALGVLSGGATAATGAGVTAAALGAGTAAAAAAAGGGFAAGGYTGDGPANAPAGIVHRGEWVVPAWRTREIGLPNLAAMTYGREGVAPASTPPTRIIIVDDRHGLDRLMRDPRFRNAVVDMAQQG